MKFELGHDSKITVVNLFSDDKLVEEDSLLSALVEKGVFNNKKQDLYFDYNVSGESTLYIALGDKESLSLDDVRLAYHKVGKSLTEYKACCVNVDASAFSEASYVAAMAEGLLQSQSVFDKYLTTKKFEKTLETVYFAKHESLDVLEIVSELQTVYEGIEVTRSLVNERAFKLYPETLANHAKETLEPVGVNVTVLDKKDIEALHMDAFLAVSLGSDKEPRFIIMEYKGNPSSDFTTALVGKGVTYDTGGYSLKPSLSMDTMFTDMGGAGTVIGTMYAIAKAKLPHNVTALVAATENDINGSAYKPGDIINSMSKKTIEVLNTDAEGRLTLADALWYAHDVVKADEIVDLATLTGACVVALGEITTAAITNDNKLMSALLDASKDAGEDIWQMPTNDTYRAMVKSDYADLLNTSKGSGAGTITAGLFLENFVNDTPWTHLDIAGTAYTKAARGYLPQGATGVHVKTLYNFVKNK